MSGFDAATNSPRAHAPPTAQLSRSFGAVADAYDRGRPTYPAEAVAVADRRRGEGRPRARRRHRQAHPRARRPGPRGLRDRARRGDARGAARSGCPRSAPRSRRPRRSRPTTASVDVVVVAPGLPLVRPRAWRCPRSPACSSAGGHVALVWNIRDQSDPVGTPDGSTCSAVRTSNQSASSSCTSRPLRLHGGGQLQALAGGQPRDHPRHGALALELRLMDPRPSARPARRRAAPSTTTTAAGMDGMQIPYVDALLPRGRRRSRPSRQLLRHDGPSQEGPVVSDGTDTDMLLIDFR